MSTFWAALEMLAIDLDRTCSKQKEAARTLLEASYANLIVGLVAEQCYEMLLIHCT